MTAGSFALAAQSALHSALEPHGTPAGDILRLLLVFLLVSAAVWLAVAAVLLVATRRRHEPRLPLNLSADVERRLGRIVLFCTVATAVVVLALSVESYLAQATMFSKSLPTVSIRVIGHQWWWEIEYEDRTPEQRFATANEIHVPVGELVRLRLETADVIHSFWAPSLAGKMDLINGQTNELLFMAERPGVYRGQCAEFCGQQHAHMGFEIVASQPEEFADWRARQSAPAATPSGDATSGEGVFRARCGICHTIRGTPADGRAGPDLTHLASRRMIAAARSPRTDAWLAAWIADPQHLKPGALMPAVPLDGKELIGLVSYLQSLE